MAGVMTQQNQVSATVRYVALGDSFTEGVGDPALDAEVMRGWADLVADGLAAHHGGIAYANLAIRGKLLEPIVTAQIDQALALDPLPTIATLNGGGNDMMRPGMDAATLIDLTEQGARRLLDAGVQPVLLAGADPSGGLPLRKVLHTRGSQLTVEVEKLARRLGVPFVNAFADDQVRAPEYWSEDRLHLNPHGHRRVANLVLDTLGVEHPEDPVLAPLRYHTTSHVRFARVHFAPWLGRRLTGRSSADGRTGKHVGWTELAPAGR
jgi:lysophospholipase L1-like esterase